MNAEENVKVLLGDPRKAIITMAVPLILSLLVGQLNVLADRAWCSGLGDDTMAAIAVVLPIYLVLMGLGNGLGVGASAVISRMIGADRKHDAPNAAMQAVIFGIIFSIALTPILFFGQHDFLLLIGKDNILDLETQYMLPYSIACIFIIMNGVIIGILNGQGATRCSMFMMIIQASSNFILDPILIYVLNMGIQGAAIATVIATALSLVAGICLVSSKMTFLTIRRTDFHYSKEPMGILLKAGVPQMLEYAVMYLMNAVLNCIVLMSAEGSHALTMYSTPDNLMDLVVIPALAVGSALVPVASSALGQNDKERMKNAFHHALRIGILAVIALTILLELFPEQFLYIFTYSEEMAQYRSEMALILRIMCIYVIFFSFTPLCSGYLQALGHPNRSVILALWRNTVLISFFLIAVPHSVEAIIWALVFGHLVGAISIFAVTKYTEKKVHRNMVL